MMFALSTVLRMNKQTPVCVRACVRVYKYVHVCIYIRGEGEGRCIDSHVLPVGTRNGSEVYKSKHQVKATVAL